MTLSRTRTAVMARTVLIVEDEATQVLLLRLHLEESGYRVLTALNGLDGLQKAMTERPDVVLLDVMLPGMSGLEVFRQLKAGDDTKDIPIIMVTASSTALASQQTDASAAWEHCLVKPYQLAALCDKLEEVLHASPRASGSP